MLAHILSQISTFVAAFMLLAGISIIVYAICEFIESRRKQT